MQQHVTEAALKGGGSSSSSSSSDSSGTRAGEKCRASAMGRCLEGSGAGKTVPLVCVTDLPKDILLEIAAFLPSRDRDRAKPACRGLNETLRLWTWQRVDVMFLKEQMDKLPSEVNMVLVSGWRVLAQNALAVRLRAVTHQEAVFEEDVYGGLTIGGKQMDMADWLPECTNDVRRRLIQNDLYNSGRFVLEVLIAPWDRTDHREACAKKGKEQFAFLRANTTGQTKEMVVQALTISSPLLVHDKDDATETEEDGKGVKGDKGDKGGKGDKGESFAQPEIAAAQLRKLRDLLATAGEAFAPVVMALQGAVRLMPERVAAREAIEVAVAEAFR